MVGDNSIMFEGGESMDKDDFESGILFINIMFFVG